MNIYPTVAASAQLASAHGSIPERLNQVHHICDNFSSRVISLRSQILQNGGDQISTNDVRDLFSSSLPGVMTEVHSHPSMGWGAVGRIRDGSVVGYRFKSCVPSFCKNLLNHFTMAVLSHEHAHIVDFAINPKKVSTEVERCQRFVEKFDLDEEITEFYSKNIYEEKPQLSLSSIGERIENLRNSITRFFSQEGLDKEEKKLLLGHWRSKVSSEHIAYGEELKAMEKFKKHLQAAPAIEQLEEEDAVSFSKYIERRPKVVAGFIFPEKAKLLGDMLREEISAHRKAHAESLRAKKSE